MEPEALQVKPYAYARLKIHDPERGYVLLGTTVFGWNFKGGDGVSQIPDWHPVNRKQALALKDQRQTDNPSSPRAFDIASPDLKARIERAEELERRFRLGLIPRPVVPNTPRGLIKGRLGAPLVPPRLEDLEDDSVEATPFLPAEFMHPTVMGEAPTESSHAHPEISSIAPPGMLQAARESGNPEPVVAGQTSQADSLPPAARAQIENLQRQILQLSGQLETIYRGPKATELYADPAAGEAPGPAGGTVPAKPKKRPKSTASQQGEGSTATPPPGLQGRMQALQGLQDASVAHSEETVQAPSAPQQAPAQDPAALKAPALPPKAKLQVGAEARAPEGKITPNSIDDPANLVDTDDPEEAAVFHRGQDLTQELEDDDTPSAAELGIRTKNPNDDTSDPDLDSLLIEVEAEKAAKDTKKPIAGATAVNARVATRPKKTA